MKLIKLCLRGAKGTRNISELIEIDFTKYDKGLIAIVGTNGAGKTTIVENLHPYPNMPSHSGSLINQFYLEGSYRDLTVEMNGNEYRFLLKIDAIHERIESYVYKNGEPINDGKRPSYMEIVNELFGSPDLYFKSVFSSQKDSGFLGMRTANRKEMFAELLGLSGLQKISDYAKERAKDIRTRIDILQSDITKQQTEIENIEPLKADACKIESAIKEQNITLREWQHKKAETENRISELKQKQAVQDNIVKQIDDLTGQIQRWSAEQITENSQYDSDYKSLESKKVHLLEQLVEYETLLESKSGIEQGLKIKQEQNDLLNKKREYESELKEAKLKLDAESDRLKSHIREIKMKIIGLEDSRMEYLESSKLIEKVPCQQKSSTSDKLSQEIMVIVNECFSDCPLISQAMKNNNQIPELDKRINELESELELVDKTELQKLIDKAGDLKSTIIQLNDKINEAYYIFNILGHNNVDLEFLEDAERKLSDAETRKEMLSQEHESNNERLESLRKSHEKKIADIQKQITEITEKRYDLKESVNINLVIDIENYEIELACVDKDIKTVNATQIDRERQLASTKSEIERLLKVKTDLEADKKELSDQKHDYTDWNTLTMAFGRNGIQALELENASPQVTEIANDILQIFDNRFQVRFDTTKINKSDGKQVEAFDITVTNSEGEQKLEDLSGGERVWIMVALQKAIAIYMRQNCDRRFDTVIADECDGALDTERAQAFYDATVKAHDIMEAQHTIFITQRREIAEQCPQRIELDVENQIINEVY